ncbi:Pentapeptide repeat-containing protein [Amycolatopsis lurida]|nr:Pentapeptide repeat-containing protein [Amycolatopsis lurida]
MPLVSVVVLAAAGVVGWLLWSWIDSLTLADPEKKATAQLDAVKISASVVVAGGGLFALYLAVRRQRTQELELEARHAELRHRQAELSQRDRTQDHAEQVAETNRLHSERVADDTKKDADARRVTELYSTSVGQLGSDHAAVRLGAMYALERLAQDDPPQRQTVVSVLCAYLRMPYAAPTDTPPGLSDQDHLQERQVRLTAQRLLHGHLIPRYRGQDGATYSMPSFWAGIDLDLTGATLIDFTLTGCAVRTFLADGAKFTGDTQFDWTTFNGPAQFNKATFTGPTRFDNVMFAGPAGFTGSAFEDDSPFGFGDGGHAKPRGNSFSDATFAADTWFSEATFTSFTSFTRATFIGPAQFDKITFSSHAGFTEATFGDIESPLRHKSLLLGTKIDHSFRSATFAGVADFRKARFADPIWFTKATFGETALFDNALIAQAVVSHHSEIAESLERIQGVDKTLRPPGWRLSSDHTTVKGLRDTWHTFQRIEPEPDDRQPA